MYNLLQNNHDNTTQLFIDGKIPYELFERMELIFNNRTKLFTICLN